MMKQLPADGTTMIGSHWELAAGTRRSPEMRLWPVLSWQRMMCQACLRAAGGVRAERWKFVTLLWKIPGFYAHGRMTPSEVDREILGGISLANQ
jgi:hypothetical protein